MPNTVIRDRKIKAVLTTERCLIRERLNDRSIPDISVAETQVEPGITTQLHSLAVREWYIISSGNGLMEVGTEAPFEIASGDVVYIPAGVSQRVTNTGSENLIFDCICLPRFTPECYKNLE